MGDEQRTRSFERLFREDEVKKLAFLGVFFGFGGADCLNIVFVAFPGFIKGAPLDVCAKAMDVVVRSGTVEKY